MKFLILSSLLSLALGSNVVPSERGLGLWDYRVYGSWVNLYEPVDGASDTFKLTFSHGKADGGDPFQGSRYIYLFKTCPHGAGPDQAKAGDANFLGRISSFDNGETGTTTANFIERVEEVSSTGYWSGSYWHTDVAFKVLPSAIDNADITTKLADSITDVVRGCEGADCADAAAVENYSVEFCILTGIGPEEETKYPSSCAAEEAGCVFPEDGWEVYGFREIIIKADFTFDGNFECMTFETQAYDPTTGAVTTEKQYQASAVNCSPWNQPLRPGVPICIETCASDDGDRDVFLDLINNMYFCEESVPDTTAPDNTFVILGETEYYPMLSVICDDENDVIGDWQGMNWRDGFVNFGCCRATMTLPARYFATVGGTGDGNTNNAGNDIFNPTTPDKATFKVCGDVDIMPMEETNGQYGPAGVDGGTRGNQCKTRNGRKKKKAAEAVRRLQESETVIKDNASLNGNLEYSIAQAEESSSKKTIAAGAAAIGALGAALLI